MNNAQNAARSLLLTLLVSSVAMPSLAQTMPTTDSSPAWLSLERGKIAYEAKDFGTAIIEFDRAITTRRNTFTLAAQRLNQALETKAAITGGDSIQATLAAFAEEDFIRRDYESLVKAAGASYRALFESLRRQRLSDSHRAYIEVLLQVLDYRTLESLQDSVQVFRTAVEMLARYPEAEYWKGRVFFVEGELSIANAQYMRAYDMRASLEIPEERYTILYSMADLHEVRADYVAWENVLKSVLAGGEPATGSAPVIDPYLGNAMITTLTEAGFDRFMTLYRLEPANTLAANAALARFYLERGRDAAVLHAALAANMSMTRIITMLEAKDRDYAWNGLDDCIRRVRSRRDMGGLLESSDLPGILLTLADALYVRGARAHAAALWRSVASMGYAPHAAVASGRLSDPGSAVRRSAP